MCIRDRNNTDDIISVCFVFVTEGSGDDGQTATWVTLIVAGGVVCIAIIIIVGVLLVRTASYRKEAKQYHQLNRYACH